MNTPAPRPRSTRQALAGREFAIGKVARPSVLTIAWRWRYELLLVGIAAPGLYLLVSEAGGILAIAIVAASAATVLLSGALRAQATAFFWWIATPHRVRAGMAQAWIHSRNGKIPIIMRTTRQPFGERVVLWCRAGTSAQDFIWGRHLIVASCWARDVRVLQSERYSHVVVLDVIRRPESRYGDAEIEVRLGKDVAEPDGPEEDPPGQRYWEEPGNDSQVA